MSCTRHHPLIVVLALCAALPLLPRPASAQSTQSASERARAAELTARAASAYRAERYDAAAQLFERAYAVAPVPELQFNLGQCYRQLKLDAAARGAFATYLNARPHAPERAQIERWVAEADEHLANARPATAPPPAPTLVAIETEAPERTHEHAVDRALAEPTHETHAPARVHTARNAERDEPSTGFYERWWFWTALGVVAAGGVTAALVLEHDRSGDSAPAGTLGTVRWN